MLESLSSRPIALSVVGALAVAIVTLIVRFIAYRRSFKKLHGDLPSPPFSMVFGTLAGLGEVMKACPDDTSPAPLMTLLFQKYKLGPIYYLDNWPAIYCRQMVINDPSVAAQITNSTAFPKHPMVKAILGSLCGEQSMFFAEGEFFKRLRSMFGPGFATKHLSTLFPVIIDEVLVFCDVLSGLAESGEIFPMEPVASKLTMDVIGHVVLDHSFNSQTQKNEFVTAYRNAAKWTTSMSNVNPFANHNPVKPFMQWYYGRQMDNYLKAVIKKRYQSYKAYSSSTKGKPSIDLALEEYINQQKAQGLPRLSNEPDAQFTRFVVDQMKTFLAAGHETTGSTMSYIYYWLHRHPESLAKVRQEFDEVFGLSLGSAAEALRREPHLISKLIYTTAVIKETLRLCPIASGVRLPAGPVIVNGQTIPTAGFQVWINSHTIHRQEEFFPSPNEFIPERFLPAPNNWQEVHKDAWRPFERGQRACFGQEFAMLEMKIIMAMTLREFDVFEQYEEWDRRLGRKNPGELLDGKRGSFGHRAYQVIGVGATPSDGMPVKVKKRQLSA